MRYPCLLLLIVLGGLFLFPYQRYFQQSFQQPSLPLQQMPIQYPVDIYWNQWNVPYIHAQSDTDLAFAMGMVHAQLRYPQLEIMRMISKGRLAKHFGPKASALDYTIRSFNYGKATTEMLATIEPKTFTWIQRYREGINHWLAANPNLPIELQMIQAQSTPWSMEDVLRLFRMGSLDVHSLYVISFLNLIKDHPEWQGLWNIYMDMANTSHPSYESVDSSMQLPYSWTKTGSNSFVVSKEKTTTGSALMANDPHVGIFIPSVWMLMGVQSPSYHAVGITIPGVPALVLGRNEHISWGGTNMYGASSYFFEIDPNKTPLETSQTFINARFWGSQWQSLRQSSYGPIVSDSPLIDTEQNLALYWEGHHPSDEISTFLSVMRAKDFKDFYQAFDTYAVSAMNYLYADKKGNIGQLMGYRQPQMPVHEKKPFYTLDQYPQGHKKPTQLPYQLNPSSHILVSTNNRPTKLDQDASWFLPTPIRHDRITTLLNQKDKLILDDLRTIQQDTLDESALTWVRWVNKQNFAIHPTNPWQTLRKWDGRYDKNLPQPYLFEMFFQAVANELLNQTYQSPKIKAAMRRSTHIKSWALQTLQNLKPDHQKKIVQLGLSQLNNIQSQSWGDYHQLKLQHMFGYIPGIGKLFRYKSIPTSGSIQTVYKRAFSIKDGRVTYGANARQLSDLSKPDENYFVLFGGQSAYAFDKKNFDQVPLWQDGQYIHFPLKLESIQKSFQRKQTVMPGR